jgi:hypothetical protein
MTTKLNIGLTQKAAEGGGGAAREAALRLELEVEPGLLDEAPRLHQRVRQVFHLLRTALAEELKRGVSGEEGGAADALPPASTGATPAAGKRPVGARRATPAQVKVIYAVARQQGVALAGLLQAQHGVSKPEALTVRQASWVIDHLKGTGGPGEG